MNDSQIVSRKKPKKIFDRRSVFFSVVIGIMFVAILIMCSRRENGPTKTRSVQNLKEVAVQLKNNGLYNQAAIVFDEYAKLADLEKQELCNVYYNIGDLYFKDKLYEKALVYFYKAQVVGKDSSLIEDIHTKIINSLERLGKNMDAQNVLKTYTSLDVNKKNTGGTLVAQLDTEEITMADINRQIDKMPNWMKKKLEKKEEKLAFAKQYIATEVLYRKAMKLGLNKNTDIQERLEEIKKQLVVQALMESEMKKITVDPEDVENYYKANMGKYQDKAKVKIVMLQFDARDEAEAALTKISGGQSFEEFLGDKKPIEEWLTLDNCTYHHIDKKLVEAALSLDKGKISDMIEVNKKIYVVKVLDKKAARQKPYEEVKERVTKEYTMRKQQQTADKMLDEAFQVEGLTFYPKAFDK